MVKKFTAVFFFLFSLLILAVQAQPPFYDGRIDADAVMQVYCLSSPEGDKLFITVKNYQEKTEKIRQTAWNGQEIETVWESGNFFEERSVLLLNGGCLRGPQNELVLVSNTRIYIIDPLSHEITYESRHDWHPGELAVGDVDGDNLAEIVFSKIEKTGLKYNTEGIRIYGWDGRGFAHKGSIETVGNIRALACLDLNRDGAGEILAEEGHLDYIGKVLVFRRKGKVWAGGHEQKIAKNAIWHMVGRSGPSPALYYISGRDVKKAEWNGVSFVFKGTCLATGSSLVVFDLAAMDADGGQEVVAAGYPNRIFMGKIGESHSVASDE
ncbi:MAG: FG-GAP repeat domain-containing protein [Bacillota bacterium]